MVKNRHTDAHTRRKGRIKSADRGTLFLDEIDELPTALQVKLLRFLQERCIEQIGGRESIDIDARITTTTNINLINIERYHWPGNVREGENRIKQGVAMADDIRITSENMELNSLTIGYSEFTLTHSREAVEHGLIQQTLKTTGATIARAASRLGVSRPTLRSVTKGLLDTPFDKNSAGHSFFISLKESIHLIACRVGIPFQQDRSKDTSHHNTGNINISHKKNQRFPLWKEPLEKGEWS